MVEVFINDRVVGRELNEEFRAWNTIGLAVRYAQTLGLYLRNDVPVLAETEKEMRARMWFALYSLEHRLCLMTGRPSAICDQDCSVPLPRPIDEEFCGMVPFEDALRNYNRSLHGSNDDSTSGYSGPFSNQFTPISSVNTKQSSSTSGPSTHSPLSTPQTSTPQPYLPVTGVATTALYFYHHIKLVRITSEVLSSLYSPSAFTRTWSDLQGIISNLELKIQQWRNDLPASLSSDVPGPTRHRTALAFQYHHARVLINRPCLRRLDLRVPNESDRSRSFNRTAATTCISAAREMVNLIPENSSATELLAIAPWWGLLHYLVTAAAILLVEISMRAEHNPQIADNLLSDVKKIIRWLRSMSVNSIAAERSWAVLVKLLMICAPKIGGDTSDVDRNLPHPHVNRTQPSEQRGPLQATVDMSPYLFRQLFDEASGISFFDTSGGQFPQASPTFPIDTIPIPPQQSPTGSHILSSRSASNHPSSPLRSQIPPILRSLSSSTTINPTPSSSMSSSLPLHSLNLPQPQPMDVGMSTVSSQESQPPIPPRAKKRLSLGVGNIELPPRPDLAPLWSLRGSDEAKNAEYLNLARESVEADGVVKGKGEKRDR